VHRIGPLLAACRPGQKLFEGITPQKALQALRHMLKAALRLPDAGDYRTHDLRRGHALDLQLAGATLGEILAAGDWNSPAFLAYLDKYRLERDLVQHVHLDDALNESDHDVDDGLC
jgi:hypothetical protein